MIAARYVMLLLPLQLTIACSKPAQAPPVEQANTSVEGATTAAPVGDERLVLALGDSLYAGYGVDQNESFPSVLEQALEARGVRARVVNAGVSGDTSAGGRARLAFTLDGLDRKPDLVIVGLGANDALRGLDPAGTRRNLDAVLAELQKRGIPVLLTGMMAPRSLGDAYVRSFDSIYPDLARKYGATLDPFFMDGIITDPKLLLADGLHPNPAGIRRMAERVAPLAQKALQPPKAG
ncbi:arylesterase [Sphingomonas lutea]|uniref:Arylesterase n=1 Tax=Sphingomonas lutea TaxID=1045317 RepID=A0A7G9SJT7_9SPHN|nr:arylesterase [Sphingomonas lutea]QNN68112.1 arylesterase [Sphingomonas lutea]